MASYKAACMQKEYLLTEAHMQIKALHRLGIWKRAALSLAAIGMIFACTGAGAQVHILREVLGIVFAVFFSGAALLIHIGQKNGKKNVEKLLKAAEG